MRLGNFLISDDLICETVTKIFTKPELILKLLKPVKEMRQFPNQPDGLLNYSSPQSKVVCMFKNFADATEILLVPWWSILSIPVRDVDKDKQISPKKSLHVVENKASIDYSNQVSSSLKRQITELKRFIRAVLWICLGFDKDLQ